MANEILCHVYQRTWRPMRAIPIRYVKRFVVRKLRIDRANLEISCSDDVETQTIAHTSRNAIEGV